jgi:hypothetical protein
MDGNDCTYPQRYLTAEEVVITVGDELHLTQFTVVNEDGWPFVCI